MDQVQKKTSKQTRSTDKDEESEVLVVQTDKDDIKQATDDLLDEIDSLLENDAAEFIRNYIQKGGE